MIGIQDFLKYRSLSELALSPNQEWAAFLVKQPLLEKNTYKKELWICELETGENHRLLTDGEFLGSFYWEDDRTIFYLADDEPQTGGEHQTDGVPQIGSEHQAVDEKQMGDRIQGTCCCLVDVFNGHKRVTATLPVRARQVWKTEEENYLCRVETQLIHQEYPEELSYLTDYEDEFEVIDEIPLWDNGRGFTSGRRCGLYRAVKKERGKEDSGPDWAVEKLTADHTNVDQVLQKPEGLYYMARTYRGRNTEPGIYFLGKEAVQPVLQVPEGIYRIFGFDVWTNPEDGRRRIFFTAQEKRIHCMTDDPGYYMAENGAVEKLPIADSSASDSVSTGGSMRLFNGLMRI